MTFHSRVSRRRRRITFMAMLAVGTASTAVSVPALAGPTERPNQPGEETTFTFTPDRSKGGVTAQSVITCSLTIDNPHKSSHVAGTANVVSHIVCSAIVTKMTLDTKLYRSGIQVGSGHSQREGWYALNGNAAATCLTAQYKGTVSAGVWAPPGYSPPFQSGFAQSSVVTVNC